jgi:hypothetical protein
LVIEAKDYKRSNSGLFVELDSMFRPPVMARNIVVGQLSHERYGRYLSLPTDLQRINTSFAYEEGLIELDEVVVKSWHRKIMDKRERVNSLHRTARKTIEYQGNMRGKSFPNLMSSLQGMVPGLSIYEDGASIRGRNTLDGSADPLYLLDGMQVDFETLNFLSPWEVDFVDILKGGEAAIYGSRGMNGVIAVYTIRATEIPNKRLEKNPDSYVHEGFYPARKFYDPVFGDFARDPKNGYSSTLYWEPMVALEATGNSMIKFPAGSRPGTFKAVVQGLTSDGVPISSESVFVVE